MTHGLKRQVRTGRASTAPPKKQPVYPAVALTLFLASSPGAFYSAKTIRIEQAGTQTEQASRDVQVRWIDTHTHPLGGPRVRATVFAPEQLAQVIATHDRMGVTKALLLMPPAPNERLELEKQLIAAARSQPERLEFLGGGFQALIQEAVSDNAVSGELRRRFEAKAGDMVRVGAVGFGEMTALHFSFTETHPYIEVQPDHPLFLLLADLGAKHDLPIDLHVEAATKELPTAARLLKLSPLNPSTVRENISALERLLAHNRKARIIWAHIGWDNTGEMTPALLRRLLQAHPNLYLQIRIPTVAGTFPQNNPLDAEGKIRPAWLELIRSFPDRCVLGSDTFMARPDFEEGLRRTGSLLQQLPPELARKVGSENAGRIYRLR